METRANLSLQLGQPPTDTIDSMFDGQTSHRVPCSAPARMSPIKHKLSKAVRAVAEAHRADRSVVLAALGDLLGVVSGQGGGRVGGGHLPAVRVPPPHCTRPHSAVTDRTLQCTFDVQQQTWMSTAMKTCTSCPTRDAMKPWLP